MYELQEIIDIPNKANDKWFRTFYKHPMLIKCKDRLNLHLQSERIYGNFQFGDHDHRIIHSRTGKTADIG
jgi:hypothetical protein